MGFLSTFSSIVGVMSNHYRNKPKNQQWRYDDLVLKHEKRGIRQDTLYSSQYLNELLEEANEIDHCDAILEHINYHDQKHFTWDIGTYLDVGVRAAERRKQIERRGY